MRDFLLAVRNYWRGILVGGGGVKTISLALTPIHVRHRKLACTSFNA